MIDERVLIFMAIVLAVMVCRDWVRVRRQQRRRDNLRHITGARPWWGNR